MAEPRMRSAKKEIVDREELHRILDEAMVMRLGMIDGERPYVVPLNFAREGDDLWFHAAKAGASSTAFGPPPPSASRSTTSSDSAPALVPVTTGARSYESVVGFGTAEIVEDPEAKLRGLRALMRKYSGREDWEFPDASVRGTAVVRIRLESLTGKRSPACD